MVDADAQHLAFLARLFSPHREAGFVVRGHRLGRLGGFLGRARTLTAVRQLVG